MSRHRLPHPRDNLLQYRRRRREIQPREPRVILRYRREAVIEQTQTLIGAPPQLRRNRRRASPPLRPRPDDLRSLALQMRGPFLFDRVKKLASS